MRPRNCFLIFPLAAVLLASAAAHAQAVKLIERPPDPHGSPRPFRDARDVPLRTSIYFELLPPADPRTLAVTLKRDNADADAVVELVHPPERFADGVRGWFRPSDKSLAIYIESAHSLDPSARYTVSVAGDAGAVASWSFTTEAAAASPHAIDYRLDLSAAPIQWHGQFFSGTCDVVFCTRADNYGPTFELMREARRLHPRAWSLHRGFWLTGTEDRPPSFFPSNLPNIVRERETRRIAAIETAPDGAVLRVEDFFGHEQYGIPAGRGVADDYHPGDEVLIADGEHHARARVLAADTRAGTVTVSGIVTPEGGWKIAYAGPLPSREDPDAPGLFPPGGCYLRKYDPPGTPCYYWGRLDKQWDLAHRDGRRVVANFADAPGDLSRDGKSWNCVKDFPQWHQVVRAIAGHIIDRYGRDSLGFTWSIFNEPDLSILFWHASWDDLQNYYDYTTDAILRAFEDRGYDSDKAFIGGLELGAIFGTNLKLSEFLAHCSPRAQAPGALPKNAAFADRRLEGQRSRRVEDLCRAHGGKGTPCDFISIHAYNRSEMMAAKLIRAREIALEIDADYYKQLWVDSHEACPDWMPLPDEAARDSYLGDGYFASWCADVVHRQLTRAQADPPFASGETILTVWPPPDGLVGMNALTRVIHYRDGDARGAATIPMPIFHALTLLSDMAGPYWVLPQHTIGGHVIGGLACRDERGVVRILVYAHHPRDTQSRSDASFDVALDLGEPGWHGASSIEEFRFDREHNSPFGVIGQLLAEQRGSAPTVMTKAQFERLRAACESHPHVGAASTDADGDLRIRTRVQGNGCNFLVVGPAAG